MADQQLTRDQATEALLEKLGIGKDKVHAAMGSFESPEELVEAGKKIYAMGYRKLDAMSPFPVHGIDDAIGIPRSKLGWIVVCFALTGIFTAQALMYYVGVINYPLVIGGKPLFDFSYSIPVTFELTILFSAFGTFLGMWGMNGLPKLYHPSFQYKHTHRASDDAFILVIEADDPKFDPEQSAQHLKSVGAADVEVVVG